MFCFNCGQKVIDGARFCSACGTDLTAIIDNGKNIIPPGTDQVSTDIQKNDVTEQYTEEQIIEEVFNEIFDGRVQFGNSVYIIRKDPITPKIKKNIQEHYLSRDPMEKPLLVFDYRKELEEGFVITNQRLVWHFGSMGQNEIELLDIKDILMRKVVLATVMDVISFDDVKYPYIYLTGIRGEAEFVAKLRKFIDALYNIFSGEEDESEDQEDHHIKVIIQACASSRMDSIYCEIGQPTIPLSSSKYINAKKNFKIPDKEIVFLIYDATILGGCRKGIAICDGGLYYFGNRAGVINWSQFKNITLSYGLTGLKIGDELFSVGGGDGKNLLLILKTIQENL